MYISIEINCPKLECLYFDKEFEIPDKVHPEIIISILVANLSSFKSLESIYCDSIFDNSLASLSNQKKLEIDYDEIEENVNFRVI